MHCVNCSKRVHGNAKLAMIALSRAVVGRSCGDNRREIRFYPCPTGEGFHLTSEPAPSYDRSRYVMLSSMVVRNAEKVLSAA
jgi:hypothetical protein